MDTSFNDNSYEPTPQKIETPEPFLIHLLQHGQKDMEILQNVTHVKIKCKLALRYLKQFLKILLIIILPIYVKTSYIKS